MLMSTISIIGPSIEGAASIGRFCTPTAKAVLRPLASDFGSNQGLDSTPAVSELDFAGQRDSLVDVSIGLQAAAM